MQIGETQIFLLIPNESNQRVLHPGKLKESGPEQCVVEFAETLEVSVDQDVNIFLAVDGKFFQQGARIAAISLTDSQMVVAFTKVGAPVSAESRQTYRVSVATCQMYAAVGQEAKCLTVDISPEGFAVLTRGNFQIGGLVDATLSFEGQNVSGKARVQGVRELPNGMRRFGFLVPDAQGAMRRQLAQLSAAVQRAQLRRLARTA